MSYAPAQLIRFADPGEDLLAFLAGPCFAFEGYVYSLAEMVEVNADDPDFVGWAKAAKVGDNYLDCERVR